jgi:hypothetical protein
MHVAFSDFYNAVPKASVIYNKYHAEYTDEHSIWLGRWVIRAERHIAQTCFATDEVKQSITDKLIMKLVTQILVSPYDHAPFVAKTEKGPVLFKGVVFPYWMLEDILNMIGFQDRMSQAKPHGFMNEMLEWSHSLRQRSSSIPSQSTALVSVRTERALVALSQTPLPSHLDSTALVSINFYDQPDLTLIKLLSYRKLILNAFREMALRKMNRGIKKQHKQIVRFGDDQKTLAEIEKTQNVQARNAHEEAINKQYEDISHIQDSTQNIMNEHFHSLIEQMNQAEEKMKKVQQECKNKEAQIQGLINAQKNLRT